MVDRKDGTNNEAGINESEGIIYTTPGEGLSFDPNALGDDKLRRAVEREASRGHGEISKQKPS